MSKRKHSVILDRQNIYVNIIGKTRYNQKKIQLYVYNQYKFNDVIFNVWF